MRTLIGRKMAVMPVTAMCLALLCGCAANWQTAALVVGGATISGAHSPNTEIEQIYYLGVFDPQEQVPPTVYRVRVHGQASFISATKFASGWVHASVIDSLGTSVEFDKDTGKITIEKTGQDPLANLKTGRRLMMFGPEGFREAPRDHRLVIVMGSSPDKFFEAVDQSLGAIGQMQGEQRNSQLQGLLFEALTHVKHEREQLVELAKDIDTDLKEKK